MSNSRPARIAHIVSKNSISPERFANIMLWLTTTNLLLVMELETHRVPRNPSFTTRRYCWSISNLEYDLLIYLTPSFETATEPTLLDEINNVVQERPVVVLIDGLPVLEERPQISSKARFVPVSFETREGLLEDVLTPALETSALRLTATKAFDDAISVNSVFGQPLVDRLDAATDAKDVTT